MLDCITVEEKDELSEWTAGCNSVNSNPYLPCGDNGCPMDLIAASRVTKEMAGHPEHFRWSDPKVCELPSPNGDDPF
jgi:hypothetical protein